MGQQRARVCRVPATATLLAVALVPAGCAGGPDPSPPAPGTTTTAPHNGTVTAGRPGTAPPTRDPEPGPEPEEDAAPEITLAVVGDLMLDRTVGDRIVSDGPEAPLDAVRPLLAEADLTIGTLETAIGTSGRPEPKAYTFQAPPESVATLEHGGFDVLALANNHILDHGPVGLAETIDLLDAAGIGHVGAGSDEHTAYAPVVVEQDGLTVAFLAYADVPDEYAGYPMSRWAATGDSAGIAWAEPDRIVADITDLAGEVDHVVVLLHSGTEGSDQVDDTQRAAAGAALDAGATLVLGSHPHVLQAIEHREGRLVAWSLGNFVFDGFDDYYEDRGVESVVLQVTLDGTGVTGFEPAPVRLVEGFPEALDPDGGGRAVLERLAGLPSPGVLDR